MEALDERTAALMNERFGKDSVAALATAQDNIPSVRYVNAYYEEGAFYVITYALSRKMEQIAVNPIVSLAGEWFTAQGTAHSMGWFGSPENVPLARKLRQAFSSWIDNGHNNFEDRNTIILRIDLLRGVLFSNGSRYEIDFTAK